jgi:DNA-binding transcriptional ArsR family regulator
MSRLKIVSLLSDGSRLTVSQIAKQIDISLKSTSKHLIILKNLDVLESIGKEGHVHYFLNKQPPSDISKALKLFI